MIVDLNGGCATLQFNLQGTATRNYDIKAYQYTCGRNDNAGPPGCLQYFTGTTGTISSFNFDTTSSTVSTAGNDALRILII